ncbi:MAG: glycosyltransferase family 4 protein [Saprospiraceae bacterium]|nr:glycosyltransferase family 4 protein [Saprospiraceae bacterium]
MLIKNGYSVVVIAPVDEYIIYKEAYPMVKHFGVRTLDRDGMNPIKDLFLILELWRRYKKIKPDLIIHFTNKPNIYGTIAAKLAGIKNMSVVTGLGYTFIHNGWMQKVITSLYKFTARWMNSIIFENTRDKNYFVANHLVDADKALSVKGCGVDTSYYKPSESLFPKENKTIFTFIGRLLYDKGINEFVEAAKILKGKRQDCSFWIVGELDPENPATVDKEDLLKWVEDDIVYYHGFIKDVRPLIQQSDCVVLPSYREGLPRIIIEGLSMAKPVITTLTAGCEETVEEGKNGYLVPVKDVHALVQAMERFLTLTEDQKIQMGNYGRIKAESEFDSILIAEQYLRLIQSKTT